MKHCSLNKWLRDEAYLKKCNHLQSHTEDYTVFSHNNPTTSIEVRPACSWGLLRLTSTSLRVFCNWMKCLWDRQEKKSVFAWFHKFNAFWCRRDLRRQESWVPDTKFLQLLQECQSMLRPVTQECSSGGTVVFLGNKGPSKLIYWCNDDKDVVKPNFEA